MTVLIVGDSFGYGSELEDANEQSSCWPAYDDPRPSDHCFGAQIANMLGQDWENYSIPGGSNDRTFRIAMSKMISKKYDLAIIIWTNPGRMDMTWQGYDMPVTYMASKFYADKFPWFQQLYENHYDFKKELEMTFCEMIAMQEYFKNQKQRYVFLNSTIDRPTIENDISPEAVLALDKENFPGWPYECLIDWCAGLPQGPNGHFLQEGHDLVAKKLYEHLTR